MWNGFSSRRAHLKRKLKILEKDTIIDGAESLYFILVYSVNIEHIFKT